MEVLMFFICVLFALTFVSVYYCCSRIYSSELKPDEMIESNSNSSSTRLQSRRLTTRSHILPKGAPTGDATSTIKQQPVLPVPHAPDIYMRPTAPCPVITISHTPVPPPLGFGYSQMEQSGWSTRPYPPVVKPPYPTVNIPYPCNSDEQICPIETGSCLPESVIIINETGISGTFVQLPCPTSTRHPLSTAQMPSTSYLPQITNLRSSDLPPPSYAEAVCESYSPTSYNSNKELPEHKSCR